MTEILHQPTEKDAYTPGPWSIGQGRDEWDFVVLEPSGNTVCEPNVEQHFSPNDFDPAVRRIPLAEAQANARLIAASPELLSSLRVLVGYLRREEHWPVKSEHMAYLSDAEAAIAKAEGGAK